LARRSREAAPECSPRRGPWVGGGQKASPAGAKDPSADICWSEVWSASVLSRRWGMVIDLSRPTAHAVGCILAPLRGCLHRATINIPLPNEQSLLYPLAFDGLDRAFPLPAGHARSATRQSAAGQRFRC